MYPTTYHSHTTRRAATRRTWLAAGGGLAAVLVVLLLAMAACNARSDRTDPLAGPAATATTPAAGEGGPASGVGTGSDGDGEESEGGQPGGGDGGNEGGEGTGDGGEDSGDQDNGDQDTDDQDTDDGEQPEPPAPLSIEVSVHTVTPGGNCFAAGTIAVSGGSYPMTVHYQWRRLVLGGGFEGEPVSAVQNVTLAEPGEVEVQTGGLPENGTNVMLIVTGPKSAGSGVVAYDGCSDHPGDIGTGG